MVSRDWSPAEDLRPGLPMTKQQPERTTRGSVWTQIVCFRLDETHPASFTQLTIRSVAGDVLVGHGRVYPITEDDGA
jgi:hypothetical protein